MSLILYMVQKLQNYKAWLQDLWCQRQTVADMACDTCVCCKMSLTIRGNCEVRSKDKSPLKVLRTMVCAEMAMSPGPGGKTAQVEMLWTYKRYVSSFEPSMFERTSWMFRLQSNSFSGVAMGAGVATLLKMWILQQQLTQFIAWQQTLLFLPLPVLTFIFCNFKLVLEFRQPPYPLKPQKHLSSQSLTQQAAMLFLSPILYPHLHPLS